MAGSYVGYNSDLISPSSHLCRVFALIIELTIGTLNIIALSKYLPIAEVLNISSCECRQSLSTTIRGYFFYFSFFFSSSSCSLGFSCWCCCYCSPIFPIVSGSGIPTETILMLGLWKRNRLWSSPASTVTFKFFSFCLLSTQKCSTEDSLSEQVSTQWPFSRFVPLKQL